MRLPQEKRAGCDEHRETHAPEVAGNARRVGQRLSQDHIQFAECGDTASHNEQDEGLGRRAIHGAGCAVRAHIHEHHAHQRYAERRRQSYIMPPVGSDRPTLANCDQSCDEQVQGENTCHEVRSLALLKERRNARTNQIGDEHRNEEDFPRKAVQGLPFTRCNRCDAGYEPHRAATNMGIKQGVRGKFDP